MAGLQFVQSFAVASHSEAFGFAQGKLRIADWRTQTISASQALPEPSGFFGRRGDLRATEFPIPG